MNVEPKKCIQLNIMSALNLRHEQVNFVAKVCVLLLP